MHIPDGFLSTPVWLSLDALSAPAIGYIAKKAQNGLEETRIPLLGVMGAFVFAAQMINFPVGIGTSGHLIGAALLAITLGPAAASIVMTAILLIQALVFQDGGILALGANVFNMAVFGVIAGYLPYRWLGSGRLRKPGIFLGGFTSAIAAACLAMSEILLSGIHMPSPVLWLSMGLFAITAALEGAITLAVVQGIEVLKPGLTQSSLRAPVWMQASVAMLALLLASVGALFASSAPDGLESMAERLGIAARAKSFVATPLADYQAAFLNSAWLSKAAAGLAGLVLIYAACMAFGKVVRRRSA